MSERLDSYLQQQDAQNDEYETWIRQVDEILKEHPELVAWIAEHDKQVRAEAIEFCAEKAEKEANEFYDDTLRHAMLDYVDEIRTAKR